MDSENTPWWIPMFLLPRCVTLHHRRRHDHRRSFPRCHGRNFDGYNDNQPPMGRTDKNSATYLSSGSPCPDFFFQVVPDTAAAATDLLSWAWAHYPLIALKLVAHLHGVHGTGKSDRKGFYSFALWLHKNHPKTLALNVASFTEFGYMKDLLEILHRILHGPDARKVVKAKCRMLMKKPGNAWKVGTMEERIEAELSKIKIEVEKAMGA